jgi:hypothetical protein
LAKVSAAACPKIAARAFRFVGLILAAVVCACQMRRSAAHRAQMSTLVDLLKAFIVIPESVTSDVSTGTSVFAIVNEWL